MAAYDAMRHVYGLVDPRTRGVRYVGCAFNLKARFRQHLRKSHTKALRNWIADLAGNGLVPELLLIESVAGYRNAISAEAEWIARYSLSIHDELLNEFGKVDFFPLHKLPGAYGRMLQRERAKRRYEEWQRRRAEWSNRLPPAPPLEFNGKRQSATDWARDLGITRQALSLRLKKYPPEVALSRGKDMGHPLVPRPPRPPKPEKVRKPVGRPRKLPHLADDSGRLSHAERRLRRERMSRLLSEGKSVPEVAAAFGVTTATVLIARREFAA